MLQDHDSLAIPGCELKLRCWDRDPGHEEDSGFASGDTDAETGEIEATTVWLKAGVYATCQAIRRFAYSIHGHSGGVEEAVCTATDLRWSSDASDGPFSKAELALASAFTTMMATTKHNDYVEPPDDWIRLPLAQRKVLAGVLASADTFAVSFAPVEDEANEDEEPDSDDEADED